MHISTDFIRTRFSEIEHLILLSNEAFDLYDRIIIVDLLTAEWMSDLYVYTLLTVLQVAMI